MICWLLFGIGIGLIGVTATTCISPNRIGLTEA